MRHGNKNNALSRQRGHRNRMLGNMACSLIEHKRIETTVAKAKALRVFVEPLITRSKEDTTHSRRVVFGYLQDKEATATLFRDVAPMVADRPGGYLRIIKLGNRAGDAAEMAMIEMVDFNTIYSAAEKTGASAKRTRRRRRSKPTGEDAQEEKATAAKADKPEAKAESKPDADKPAKGTDDK